MTELRKPAKGKSQSIEVVRVRRSYWSDGRGLHMEVSILPLKRKSHGHQTFREEAMEMGVEFAFPKILNLDECADGVYSVSLCNISRDWETGHFDGCEYRLVPFEDSV